MDQASIREELSSMSFEELQKLKEKIGTKLYNSTVFNKTSSTEQKASFSRENKNRPQEISSRFPVKRHRDVVATQKKIKRDPRFDDLSGNFNEKVFEENYKFIKDIKHEEKQHLLKELEEVEDPVKKKKIQTLIKRYDSQEQEEKRKQFLQETKKEYLKQQLSALKEGKKVYFPKKSETRKEALAEKFLKLKGSGKLNEYLKKKRKRNATKEHKNLPGRNEKEKTILYET